MLAGAVQIALEQLNDSCLVTQWQPVLIYSKQQKYEHNITDKVILLKRTASYFLSIIHYHTVGVAAHSNAHAPDLFFSRLNPANFKTCIRWF